MLKRVDNTVDNTEDNSTEDIACRGRARIISLIYQACDLTSQGNPVNLKQVTRCEDTKNNFFGSNNNNFGQQTTLEKLENYVLC